MEEYMKEYIGEYIDYATLYGLMSWTNDLIYIASAAAYIYHWRE
jgi:hypothetical protein